jgi:hypothetical protein
VSYLQGWCVYWETHIKGDHSCHTPSAPMQ